MSWPTRRDVLAGGCAAAGSALFSNHPSRLAGAAEGASAGARNSRVSTQDLRIRQVRVIPLAFPDPPILAASGCHGPYFLRHYIEIHTDAGIVGIGETRGGRRNEVSLQRAAEALVGQSVFSYLRFPTELPELTHSAYAGLELACLDAIGKATGRRLCELLGGPVREEVEFASYLFYRYAADHPVVLADERIVDQRGRGDQALDDWGEVRTPEAMAEMAWKFHQKWGFRIHKLKAGVLEPDVELATLEAMHQRLGDEHLLRIDPNGRWKVETAVRIGERLQDLPLDYYEDPVRGQEGMAEVRRRTGLPMSTNSCVTAFAHIPDAVVHQPIDVVLGDHHGWGGIPAFQALGRMAEVLQWGVSQHSNNHAGVTMAAMIHVGALVPQMNYASDTHYVWLVDEADLLEGGKLPIRGGKMEVPRGPGLGVKVDSDRLARAHETYQKTGMRARDDGFLMRQMQPGWKRDLF